jgi:subtilase family serine protease
MAAALALAGVWAGAAGGGTAMAASAAPEASSVVQAAPAAAVPSAKVAAAAESEVIDFSVSLPLRDPAGAVAFEEAVTSPTSHSYGKYLTPEAWEARFSPTEGAVTRMTTWLTNQGLTVLSVTPDRMTIHVSGTVAQLEKIFGAKLGEYRVGGHQVRLSQSALSVPSAEAKQITAITGISQSYAHTANLTGSDIAKPTTSSASAPAGGEPILPPEGFRIGRPCSNYWAQDLDTTDPPYGDGFPEPLPYAVCGYKPAQIQGAYGLTPQIAAGDDGKGVTVAIVDAFASPTLFADAHQYSENNQPGEVLEASQFSEKVHKPFVDAEACEASGWSTEQTLDVESVHATAPGAHILYDGGSSCLNEGLDEADQEIIDKHLASVITNSWTGNEGELLEEQGTAAAFNNVLLMADGTGVGVQFSAGDEGDEYTVVGMNVSNYPASSPYVTAVGGTSLEVSKRDERIGEFGWSTGKSVLCTELLAELGYPGCTAGSLETYLPPAPSAYDYGGGGGTTYLYPEPAYQDAVVPAALAERNSAVTHERNRVVPDISMDADPSTGFTIGITQQFPKGVAYGEYRLGGTSLSSPLFAGVMADADQAAGKPLGFANPVLYYLDSLPATAEASFYDVVPGGKQAVARVDNLNGVSPAEGTLTSVRVIEYEGKQRFCDGAGNCEAEKNILSTAPGYDSMTGIGTPGAGLISELGR